MAAYLIHNREISFRLSEQQRQAVESARRVSTDSSDKESQQAAKRNAEVTVQVRKDNVMEYNGGKTLQDWNAFSALQKLIEAKSSKEDSKVMDVKIEFENPPKTSFVSELKISLQGEILNSIKATFGKEVRIKLEISGAKVKVGKCEPVPLLPKKPAAAETKSPQFGASAGFTFEFGKGAAFPGTNALLAASQKLTPPKSTAPSFNGATDSTNNCTAEMHLQQNKDMQTFCEDLMVFPTNWRKQWESDVHDASDEFIANISIIVIVLDYQNSNMFGGQQGYNSGRKDIFNLNKRLLQDEIGADVTFTVSTGKEYKCHSAFLIAQSEVLKTMLEKSERKRFTLTDTSEEGMMGLLSYLYYRDIESALSNSNVAVELLQVANQYLVQGLENDLKNILLDKPCTWYDPDAAVKLFLFARKSLGHISLQLKSVKVMKLKSVSVMACKEFKKIFQVESDLRDDKKEEADENTGHHIAEQLQIAKDFCSALLNTCTTTNAKNE